MSILNDILALNKPAELEIEGVICYCKLLTASAAIEVQKLEKETVKAAKMLVYHTLCDKDGNRACKRLIETDEIPLTFIAKFSEASLELNGLSSSEEELGNE